MKLVQVVEGFYSNEDDVIGKMREDFEFATSADLTELPSIQRGHFIMGLLWATVAIRNKIMTSEILQQYKPLIIKAMLLIIKQLVDNGHSDGQITLTLALKLLPTIVNWPELKTIKKAYQQQQQRSGE